MIINTILRVAVGTSVLTVVLMLIRKLFGDKLEPNIRYILWLFVALRILFPVKIDYILPGDEWLKEKHNTIYRMETNNVDIERNHDITEYNIYDIEPSLIKPQKNVTKIQIKKELPSIDEIFTITWLVGVIVFGSYILINNYRFYAMVKKQRKDTGRFCNKIPLFELRGHNCLQGVFKPAIYIDSQAYGNPKLRNHVILHELQHFRAKDNFWILIRNICLILQWFNPFVWLAYIESGRDCELACDYRVIKYMGKEERYLYGDSLLSIAALQISTLRKTILATSMGTDKRVMKRRIESIMKYSRSRKKVWGIPFVFILFATLAVTVNIMHKADDTNASEIGKSMDIEYSTNLTNEAKNNNGDGNQKLDIDISDYYITNTGYQNNLYYIDDQKILWGSGENQYGQLGQGNQDTEFYKEMVKISENVIHVDYSQAGFMIFITEDHKLYGCGNGGVGALRQLVSFSDEQFINGTYYAVTKPVLLMENVSYARCGRYDIVAIDMDNNVLNWGLIWYENRDEYVYRKHPQKILENTVLVTGGMYNHAALKKDGSVWTWGYNYSGNCGVPNKSVISEPQKVAENVRMVWTGSLNYNIDCQNIKEFGEFADRGLENTIIQKNDGSFWVCGAGVGTEEKLLPSYYQVVDYSMVCTHEFLPYEIKNLIN